jgi:hypothetical protein
VYSVDISCNIVINGSLFDLVDTLTQASRETIFLYSHNSTHNANPSAEEVARHFEQSATLRTVVTTGIVTLMVLNAERWQHADVTSANDTPPGQ